MRIVIDRVIDRLANGPGLQFNPTCESIAVSFTHFPHWLSGQMLARRLSKVLSHQYDLNEEDYAALMDIYGVRRTSPEFWAQSDLLHDAYRIAAPVESGVYDINRFENR